MKVVVDRNTGTSATAEFRFDHVPSPVKNNAASQTKLSLVVGRQAPNGG